MDLNFRVLWLIPIPTSKVDLGSLIKFFLLYFLLVSFLLLWSRIYNDCDALTFPPSPPSPDGKRRQNWSAPAGAGDKEIIQAGNYD